MNYQKQDRRIFERLVRGIERKGTGATIPGELILDIGRFFLGKPYKGGTLETKRGEHLVINLREFDCTTFVENVTVLAQLHNSRERSYEAFRRLLRKTRYRQGKVEGYPSRLHYFSDWIHDNRKKGIVRDVTVEIGARPLKKAVTFMTTHPDLYPPLKNGATFRRMESVEKAISARPLFLIPKKAVKRLEARIHEGDLIAITTRTEGLDVQHAGIAARVRNRIHLLHASSAERKVVLSKETLYGYLMQRRSCSGIRVARIVERKGHWV